MFSRKIYLFWQAVSNCKLTFHLCCQKFFLQSSVNNVSIQCTLHIEDYMFLL